MTTFYDKTGLPKSLAWGFIGVLIFMMGDGIEQTWLSRYIASQGLDHEACSPFTESRWPCPPGFQA